ncbi:MAG: 30S ribosomal protein S6 [Patescibacteria group bacterium]|nr:30S ribosomal protein S6 [Patescibacteria group bacterium]
MSHYELTFLLAKNEDVEKIKEIILSFQGEIEKEESWGEKTLAYPIKKHRTAFYFHWLIKIPKTKVLELRKKLNFQEKIIRYLLLVKE